MADVAEVPGFSLQQTRYRVLGPLGRGGMATVYRARDTALGRDVALKLFAAMADDVEQLRAQQREAQLLASFRHHSLVTLFDAGVDFDERGTPRMFLTMELIDGPDLRERLRGGPLPLLSVAHLGFDLGDALAYLHDRGVTHRDLKPANVLLVERPGTRLRVKLADFGIAQIGEEHGDPEETTGTAAYLSPEQAAGEPVRQASDVYSLGLLLLEAITGRVVFPGGVVESALARLDRSPAVPDDLPAHWRELLTAMTARRAADRPTAAEVATGFRQVLIDEVAAAKVADDPERLVSRTAAVRRYDLLSGRPDPATDRICGLAARLLGAPAAVVAVHDDDRLLIASRTGDGWSGDPHGVLEDAALEVAEIDGPVPPLAAMRPGTRAYASAPSRTADGFAVATLAVLFDEPRRLTADERSTLQDLADAVLHEAEMRRAVRRLLLGPAT